MQVILDANKSVVALYISYRTCTFLDRSTMFMCRTTVIMGLKWGDISGGLIVLPAFDFSQIKTRTMHKYIIMQLVNSDEIVIRCRMAKHEEVHCSSDFNANLHNQDETTHRQSWRNTGVRRWVIDWIWNNEGFLALHRSSKILNTNQMEILCDEMY